MKYIIYAVFVPHYVHLYLLLYTVINAKLPSIFHAIGINPQCHLYYVNDVNNVNYANDANYIYLYVNYVNYNPI